MKDIKIINNKSMKTSYSLKSGLFFAYAFILNLENPLVRSIKDFCILGNTILYVFSTNSKETH
ncbi:hypothetical protein ABB05_10290 [Lederbergia galactosidilytica]|uniref:Uncharacterized protein n=1 Tax=Lederbergia galactosidilytica TaxID=217031 RepID=A0A177ZTW6_9BACI|nr:hypothetical protein ABB05_10290 [Lederbergia galactosidilytica]